MPSRTRRHLTSHKKKPHKHKKKKGMHSRHRHKTTHKKTHTKHKHGHKKSRSMHKAGGRAGGAGKPGRRMDSYHMRRRFMHAGAAGGGGCDPADFDPFKCYMEDPSNFDEDGALGVGMFGYDDDMEDNPFIDDGLFDDEGLLEDFEEEGSESEENASEPEEEHDLIDGPPALESDNHYHVFFYHSSATEDQEQIEHYVNIIENSPNDLKVLTSEKDFKPDLSTAQNLMLTMALSQKTVLHCTNEFIENDLSSYDSAVQCVMPEEERKKKVIVLLGEDANLPASLQIYPKILSLGDLDCFEKLTKMLMTTHSRPHHIHNSNERSNTEPSAPPMDGSESPMNHAKEDNHPQDTKEPTTNYANGSLIKKVTARKYSQYEADDAEKGLCAIYCPKNDLLCPGREPTYIVPEALTKRGLQVTKSEFTEILNSLNEAANVTFFRKAADCSLPCLFLSAVLTISVVCCCLWFLVAGASHHYREEGTDISSTLFWSFMVLIFFIPAATALIMLAVVLHLVNYKYLKYRIKIEEFNKRFRETNLVLHVRKGFWVCSGKLKLFFIYYDFEECQKTLYCHVHDNVVKPAHSNGEENEKLLNEIATVKLDKIMKRVNTLTKKFEWSYFEALTTHKLPTVDQKEHRKKGMCFCQFVLHNEQKSNPPTIVEHVKGQVTSMKKNALKKSHRRRDTREYIPAHYMAPTITNNGMSRFSDKKSSAVTFT